ncbi:MAG TPA: AraC family transcriptional regulator [Thermoanaerobaculia bacterium]|nr:AraC family transcriptional regulator [Thermoanaerobaculia bacterium]
MPLDIHLKPVESLLFRGEVVAMGTFRCEAEHPLYRDSGPCSYHTFAFPRTMTRIRHEEGTEFVGAPGRVAFYNQHQLYTRTRISGIDASDWFTIADDVLLELVREHDPRATPERPFRIAEGVSDAQSFLEQRRLFDGAWIDAMEIEELVLQLLRRVMRAAYGSAPRRTRMSARDIDAVEHVRRLIAAEPSSNVSLRALARAGGCSPFQLCRLFRARTGETITRFRHSLRLSLALERLRDSHLDVSTLALDLGYSSHSHFTYAFRRHFGITPRQFRATA